MCIIFRCSTMDLCRWKGCSPKSSKWTLLIIIIDMFCFILPALHCKYTAWKKRKEKKIISTITNPIHPPKTNQPTKQMNEQTNKQTNNNNNNNKKPHCWSQQHIQSMSYLLLIRLPPCIFTTTGLSLCLPLTPCKIPPLWPSGKPSVLRMTYVGSAPIFLHWVTSVIHKLVLWWKPCQALGIIQCKKWSGVSIQWLPH